MPIKSLLGALAFVVGAIVGAVWIVDAMPGARTQRPHAPPRVVGSAPPEGLLSGLVKSPLPASEETAPTRMARAEVASDPQPIDLEGGTPPAEEPAFAASRAISEPVPEATDDERPAPSAAGAFTGAAVATLCKGAGSACGSSAECCPGLACAGGVAGYGTPGRCEGDTAR